MAQAPSLQCRDDGVFLSVVAKAGIGGSQPVLTVHACHQISYWHLIDPHRFTEMLLKILRLRKSIVPIEHAAIRSKVSCLSLPKRFPLILLS
jgi:hypothetical protein